MEETVFCEDSNETFHTPNAIQTGIIMALVVSLNLQYLFLNCHTVYF